MDQLLQTPAETPVTVTENEQLPLGVAFTFVTVSVPMPPGFKSLAISPCPAGTEMFTLPIVLYVSLTAMGEIAREPATSVVFGSIVSRKFTPVASAMPVFDITTV